MRVASIDRCDLTNAPGVNKVALTIWFAGCSYHCEGCHNPDLQDRNMGLRVEPDAILDVFRSSRLDYGAVVLTGGDPLHQDWRDLSYLCQEIKHIKPDVEIWLYTGMTRNEIEVWINRDDDMDSIIEFIDVLKVGRYDKSLATDSFPASSNQEVFRVKTEYYSKGKFTIDLEKYEMKEGN